MDDALRRDIAQVLSEISAYSPVLQRAEPDKAYELFIFGCVIKALQDIGATNIQPRDSDDNPSPSIRFRLGPGLINGPTPCGFIYFQYGRKEFELHNSLRVLGSSKVLHELDICILTRDEAIKCRQAGRTGRFADPRSSQVRLVLECKFYSTPLSLSLGREYLGLSQEYSCRAKSFVSNIGHDDIRRLISRYSGTTHFFIMPTNKDDLIKWLGPELRHGFIKQGC